MKIRPVKNRAFALIECYIYIAIVTVLASVAFSVFLGYFGSSRRLQKNLDDIMRVMKAGEMWRADVRAATGPILAETDRAAQVLRIPQENHQVTYLVVLGAVWRLVDDQAADRELITSVKSSRMIEDTRARVMAWRWELELKTTAKKAKLRPKFTFMAVPCTLSTTNRPEAL